MMSIAEENFLVSNIKPLDMKARFELVDGVSMTRERARWVKMTPEEREYECEIQNQFDINQSNGDRRALFKLNKLTGMMELNTNP